MLETIRDLSIIFLALLNIILILMLIVLVFVVLRLLRQLQREIPTLLDPVKRTLTTVEGTTSFVSKTTVTPVIRASATVAAVSRFAQVMLGTHKPKGR